MLVFHHCLLLLTGGGVLSLSEGELLAGVRGFRPSLLRLNGKLLGPVSPALALFLSLVLLNFLASSDVKVTLEVLPPRNLSQPGAPRAAMVAGDVLDLDPWMTVLS